MIELKVSDDIELALVREEFIPEFLNFVKTDFDYLSKWLEWPRVTKTASDFEQFVLESKRGYESSESMNCAILYKGAVAGVGGFNKIDVKLRRVEVGYWLGKAFQKCGIATSACAHLIKYAFSLPEIDKVQISVAVGNKASRAVCERLNMHLEGIVTNEERIGNKVLDHAIYALHK